MTSPLCRSSVHRSATRGVAAGAAEERRRGALSRTDRLALFAVTTSYACVSNSSGIIAGPHLSVIFIEHASDVTCQRETHRPVEGLPVVLK